MKSKTRLAIEEKQEQVLESILGRTEMGRIILKDEFTKEMMKEIFMHGMLYGMSEVKRVFSDNLQK